MWCVCVYTLFALLLLIGNLVSHAGLVQVGKVWVVERGLCSDTLGRLVPHHVCEQLHAVRFESWDDRLQVLGRPPWERWLVVWQGRDAWPCLFGWCAQQPEDSVKLINLRVAREQWTPCNHFSKDWSQRPHVDWACVLLGAEQDLRCTVPQRHHFVRVGTHWDAKGTGEAKVGELDVAVGVDQQVLWFQISVQDTVCMAKLNALQQLPHVTLDKHRVDAGDLRVHVLFQVFVEELKDEVKLVLGVHNFVKPDNGWVVKFLQQGNLSDGSGWDTFIFSLNLDLLQRNDGARASVNCLVDGTVGAFAKLFNLLVLLHDDFWCE